MEIWFPSFDTQHAYSVSYRTDCSSTFFGIIAPQLHPWFLSHTFQIPYWKLVEDTTCMRLDSLQCLVACVWLDSNESWTCGYGVVVFGWLNCFGRNWCHLGCVDLWDDKDLLGSEFPDHLGHGRSNELINFCPEWSHQFIWSTMIWVISDHLSSFGSSQRTHS